jgi:hypothetical protein
MGKARIETTHLCNADCSTGRVQIRTKWYPHAAACVNKPLGDGRVVIVKPDYT